MTEIDVPDWVVEVACHAAAKAHGDYLWPEEWMDGDDATLADEARATIRAALTAALGAWVVHEGFFDPDAMDHLRSNVIDPVGVLRRKSNGISTVAIYTLRQEKPE